MTSIFCPSLGDFAVVPPTLSLVFLVCTIHLRFRSPERQPEKGSGTASSTPTDTVEAPNDNLFSAHGKHVDPTLVRTSLLVLTVYTLNNLVLCTFLTDVAILAFSGTLRGECLGSLLYYDLVSSTAWTFNLIGLYFGKEIRGKWGFLQHGFWFGATLLELGEFGVLTGRLYGARSALDILELFHYYLFAFRALFLAIICACLVLNIRRRLRKESIPSATSISSIYGTFNDGTEPRTPVAPATVSHKETPKVEQSAFANFGPKIKQILPFLYPAKDLRLQFIVLVCIGLLFMARVLNILIPIQMKQVVDSLSTGDSYFAWNQIIMLYVVKFIQGSGGIDALRTYLWVPIHQYTTRKLSVKILSHLHSLSLEYHLNRQTGEVLRIVDRGTTSVQDIFQSVLFRFLPAVADALIGVSYFTFAYGWSFGLIIFVVVIFYVAFTIGLTEQRTRYSRESNELDQEAEAMIVDSLLNYETVKYYTAEEFEIRRYANAVAKYQKLEFQSANTNNLLWIGQDTVINAGLCVGSLLLVWRVVHRELTVGDYVFFGQYIMQMFGQFGILGWIYIDMQHSLVDMEKMLELLKVEPTVKDSPDSKALVITEGNIVFDNVSFFYDHRNYALRKISFTIPKGATVALVGPSGGGKTTILRLLFRFYDVTSGRILVDGQDIRTVTQRSLRQSIGVVPQETSLFNESIMFNIRYGSFDATDEEVYAAAKAALIHDRIVAFPDGYESIIGERGLKLSGGEKQRVAIARMFLKNPPILFLDEATSALDSTTERLLQNSLATMTKDRTTIVIAHRLSTIVDADLILCISDGQVVESGTHGELMQSGQNGTSEGIYYKMYQKQTKDRVKTTLQTDAVDEVSDNSPSDRNTV